MTLFTKTPNNFERPAQGGEDLKHRRTATVRLAIGCLEACVNRLDSPAAEPLPPTLSAAPEQQEQATTPPSTIPNSPKDARQLVKDAFGDKGAIPAHESTKLDQPALDARFVAANKQDGGLAA